MGIVFRQSVKATITTICGAVLGALINYWQPKYFSAVEVGLNRYLVNWGAISQYIILLGMHNTIVTFLPRYSNDDERRRVMLGAGFIVPVVACMILSIPYFLFKGIILQQFKPQDIPYINRYYPILPVMVLIWSFMTLSDAYLITRMKVAISSFVRDVVLRLANILLIFLFAIRYIDFNIFILGTLVTYLLPTLLLIWISKKTKGFGFSLTFGKFSRVEWNEIIHFSQYHLLAGLALNLVGFIDSLLLPGLDKNGLKSLAAYSIAVYLASMLSITYRAMSGASFPSLNEAYIANDRLKLADLYKRSAINILIVGACILALVISNLQILVSFLPVEYAIVSPLTLILILGRLADMATGMNSEVISISSHYKFFFRLSVALLIILMMLCRVLIPIYGVYGAAWSASLSLLIFNVAKTIFLWRKFHLHPFTRGSLNVLIAAGISCLIGYLLPISGIRIIDLGIKSLTVCVTYFLMLLWLKPSADLQNYVQTILKERRLF